MLETHETMSACDVVENRMIRTIDLLAPLAQLSVLKGQHPEHRI